MLVLDPPEQGQLVQVRQRQYVVSEVVKSGLEARPLYPNAPVHHLVTLQSVEDDALGEELQVIWELEAGAHVYESVPLPNPRGFDEPATLDAFLNAVRWGAVSSANRRALQAPFRSGVDIEDYQLEPVVRALQMPRVNLLLADDVGLGKTIEAGLVIQELLLRHRARTVLVVCPSSLQTQWRDQMRDKFGLEFRIVDSALFKELRRKRGLHANPWTHFPRLVTSIDFLKRERPLGLVRDVLPKQGDPAFPRKFDVLVIDEAHCVAPSGHGRYATDSLRTQAIRLLAPHFEHKLFLTATPHNGYAESFSALLEILDNQRFARTVKPSRAQLSAVMVRRLKTEMKDRNNKPRFPRRELVPLEVDHPASEKRIHAALREYTGSRLQGLDHGVEAFAAEFVLKTLKKRLFSSPAAFQTTLAQHERSLRSARKRGSQGFHVPSPSVLRQQVERLDEDFADDVVFEECSDELVDTATRLFRDPSPRELELLEEMRTWADDATGRPDAKARELLRWLDATLRPTGTWNDRRVIIFTEYRATQKWLHNLLATHGFTEKGRLGLIYGGMDSREREAVKGAFQASAEMSEIRILLATDAASEAIDLQNHCARLIHYEIPWNPNRMEQRNGRIDRHGQQGHDDDDGNVVWSVLVYHFVGRGYSASASRALRPGDLEGDLEFLMRAALKVDAMREDLGKVGPLLAEQVENAMLGKDILLAVEAAEKGAERARGTLKFEANVREQLTRLVEQLGQSREALCLSPEHVEQAVAVALRLANQPGLIPEDLSHGRKAHRIPPFGGSTWNLCTMGLAHPHSGHIRPITFDAEVARGHDDVVLAHLNHRLVQQAVRLLRAEIWASEGHGRLQRATVRVVPDGHLDAPAIVAHARLVIIGGDCHRLHEEVISAGLRLLDGGRHERMNVTRTQDVLDAATNRQPGTPMQNKLLEAWPRYQEACRAALEARSRERAAQLQKTLADAAQKEAEDVRALLAELQRAIQDELDPGKSELPFEQLELFSPEEMAQYEVDRSGLRARLAQIPSEIEREVERVEARYASPQARLFPVALTFLVPQRMAGR